MTRFRPCIDLHGGRVKQIVGSTLTDQGDDPQTNFVSEQDAGWFARRYAEDELTGGHVIQLGPGNREQAERALGGFPGGLQLGGGVKRENATEFLRMGASHVIVTSHLFDEQARFCPDRLEGLVSEVGAERLVIDLSCRATEDGWVVAMNRWQTPTDLVVDAATLSDLATSCDEFLVHAVDVEGKCEGIDEALVEFLGRHCSRPVTYAGGIHSMEDFHRIQQLSDGRVDATVGSALDMFGGQSVRYTDCLAFNRRATA